MAFTQKGNSKGFNTHEPDGLLAGGGPPLATQQLTAVKAHQRPHLSEAIQKGVPLQRHLVEESNVGLEHPPNVLMIPQYHYTWPAFDWLTEPDHLHLLKKMQWA